MDGLILTPYIMTEALAESEDCGLNMATPITIPGTNVYEYALSTHRAMANTTVNSRKEFFSELTSPGYSDGPNICNTEDIQHVQQTHQQQQMAVPPAEHDRQTFLSSPTSHTLPRNRKTTAKIPRPPNAFILFSNKWRKKMAEQHPWETNMEISKRLGLMWKSINDEEKGVYVALARKADEKHKKDYPGYVYNPKEARVRKALRAKGQDRGTSTWQIPAVPPFISARQQAAKYQQCGIIHGQAWQ